MGAVEGDEVIEAEEAAPEVHEAAVEGAEEAAAVAEEVAEEESMNPENRSQRPRTPARRPKGPVMPLRRAMRSPTKPHAEPRPRPSAAWVPSRVTM